MTQKQTEYFKRAYELGNMTLASEQLYVSRSALSYAIAEIENEFQVALFTRTTTGIEPTEAGTLLYNSILRNENEMKILVRQMQALNSREEIKRINLAVSITNDSIVVPILYDEYAMLHPNMDIRIHDLPALDIPEAICDGSIDIGISPAKLDNYPAIDSEDLYSVNTEVVISRNHPLADRTVLTAEDLAQLPLAAVGTLPSAMNNNFRNILSVIGAEPKIVANLYDWSLVKFLVQRGYVGAYVSTDISSKWQGVKSIPILGLEMTSTHKVMWSRELGKDSEAQNIIKFLVERLKKQ